MSSLPDEQPLYQQRSSENHCLHYFFLFPIQNPFFRQEIPQPKATDGKHKFISFATLNKRGGKKEKKKKKKDTNTITFFLRESI